MPTIGQIAQDPRKALKDLEKELGAAPGSLLEAMDALGGGDDDDWSQHLPYGAATSYYDNAAIRAQHQGHVDECGYCKALLQTLHPPAAQVTQFAAEAAQARRPRSVPAYSIPLAAAASAVVVLVGAVLWLQVRAPLIENDAIAEIADMANPVVAVAHPSACGVEGLTPEGCELLARAADFEKRGDVEIARALVVAGLAKAGVQASILKRVNAAIDPALPSPDVVARERAASETSPEPTPADTALLVAAQSNFKAGESLAGYEKVLAYLERSEGSDVPAKAFEIAFVEPVRATGPRARIVGGNAPSTAWVESVQIGSKIDEQGSIADGEEDTLFSPGQAVHIVTEVADAPSDVPVRIVWYGPNDHKLREEINWTVGGEKYLAFTAQDTAAWKTGDYRAELWVADKRIKEQTFAVR